MAEFHGFANEWAASRRPASPCDPFASGGSKAVVQHSAHDFAKPSNNDGATLDMFTDNR